MKPEKNNETKQDQDFFGGQETQKADLPRYAINKATDDQGKKIKGALEMLEATYECTITEINNKGKTRLLHQVVPRQPIEGAERILVWGNYSVDRTLPTLAEGTRIRLTYKGKQQQKEGRTLKLIDIEFPTNTKRVQSAFAPTESDGEDID